MFIRRMMKGLMLGHQDRRAAGRHASLSATPTPRTSARASSVSIDSATEEIVVSPESRDVLRILNHNLLDQPQDLGRVLGLRTPQVENGTFHFVNNLRIVIAGPLRVELGRLPAVGHDGFQGSAARGQYVEEDSSAVAPWLIAVHLHERIFPLR